MFRQAKYYAVVLQSDWREAKHEDDDDSGFAIFGANTEAWPLTWSPPCHIHLLMACAYWLTDSRVIWLLSKIAYHNMDLYNSPAQAHVVPPQMPCPPPGVVLRASFNPSWYRATAAWWSDGKRCQRRGHKPGHPNLPKSWHLGRSQICNGTILETRKCRHSWALHERPFIRIM